MRKNGGETYLTPVVIHGRHPRELNNDFAVTHFRDDGALISFRASSLQDIRPRLIRQRAPIEDEMSIDARLEEDQVDQEEHEWVLNERVCEQMTLFL